MKEVDEKNGEKELLGQPSNVGNADDKKHRYEIRVNDSYITFQEPFVVGKQILKEAGFDPVECFVLYQKFKDCEFELISSDEKIDLSRPGIERFIVKKTDVFHYTVDEEPESSHNKFMTPKEILVAFGLDPKDYYLVELLHNQRQKSYKGNPDEQIELKCPGNKFITVFNGETPVS